MRKTVTKSEITQWLFGADEVQTIIDSNGKSHKGFVHSIKREDGSGRFFNVRLHVDGYVYQTISVRTAD